MACAITLTKTLTVGDVITNPKPNPSRSRNPNPRQWAWPEGAWPNMQMSCQSTKCSPVIGWWPGTNNYILLAYRSERIFCYNYKRHLACTCNRPGVCHSTSNSTLTGKRGSVREPSNVKICSKLWFSATASRYNEHIHMKLGV